MDAIYILSALAFVISAMTALSVYRHNKKQRAYLKELDSRVSRARDYLIQKYAEVETAVKILEREREIELGLRRIKEVRDADVLPPELPPELRQFVNDAVAKARALLAQLERERMKQEATPRYCAEPPCEDKEICAREPEEAEA